MEETQPIDGDVDDTDEPNADRMDVELPFSLQVGITRHFAIETSNEIPFFFLLQERDIPISKPFKKPKARDLDKVLRAKSERRHKKESAEGRLDPMDPAAYSDIPR